MIETLSKHWHYLTLAVAVAISGVAHLTEQPAKRPTGWVGVDTHVGKTDGFQALQTVQNSALMAIRNGGKLVVFPEAVGGDWDLNRLYWSGYEHAMARRGVTVLIGAEKRLDDRRRVNALFSVGAQPNMVLHSRVPVPLGMWNPWSKTRHFVSDWAGTGTIKIRDQRVLYLICYEQLLMWPVLRGLWNKPTIIVGSSNAWWSKGTTIPGIQNATLEAWGRLFKIPLVTAVNT
ncbi:hypothetical protein ACFFU8_08845 [Chromobacterium piscinae]|uniref:hypothetical protein n=1 Tax=Chromobacterium piscinae TaxID=686831 RepID=UPI001E34FB07|nr:hypothetical protein [Chromobacterium piscinae]MCD5327989.1 hypothetical protein [Chromobacterium piscinae]